MGQHFLPRLAVVFSTTRSFIALINTITTDILLSWYLMAKYSDGSGKFLLSLTINVGRLKVFPNNGDRKHYCEDEILRDFTSAARLQKSALDSPFHLK